MVASGSDKGAIMSIHAVPHLNFYGNARQALEFYHAVFGGELVLATYADFGAPNDTPIADTIVWGQVTAANGFRLMAYDIPTSEPPAHPPRPVTSRVHGLTLTQDPFFISLRGEQVNEVLGLWEQLVDQATIIEPIAQTPWAQMFGMLTDRFGITWVVDVG